jgi:LysM repeat protein
MKSFLLLFASLSLAILLSACETTDPQNDQFASSNQDIVELQNDVAVLKRKMVNSKTNNMRIMKHISSLQSQINYVNEHNQQQNQTINSLNQKIAKERAERKVELNKAVETIADQTTKAVNAIAKQSRSKAVKGTKSMPAGAYYKHKVEPGETLSAIARAYKVSVKDIKQANNLKSNIIRVRQILHIPKK